MAGFSLDVSAGVKLTIFGNGSLAGWALRIISAFDWTLQSVKSYHCSLFIPSFTKFNAFSGVSSDARKSST